MATRKKTASSNRSKTTKKAASKATNTRKKSNTTAKTNLKNSQELTFESEILLWILLAVSILLFVSNFGIGGKVGNGASSVLFGLFGLMAYIFPILLFIGSCFVISNKGNHFAIFKFVAVILLFCSLCMFLQLLVSAKTAGTEGIIKNAYIYSSDYKAGGGALGGIFVWLCVPNFGTFGSFVIDIILIIISLVLITERSIFSGMKRGGQKVYETAREDAIRYHDNQQRRREERELRRVDKKVEGVALDTSIRKPKRKKRDDISEITAENIPEILDNSNNLESINNANIIEMPEIRETSNIAVSSVQEVNIPPEPENAMPFNEEQNEPAWTDSIQFEPVPVSSVHKEVVSVEPVPDYDDASVLEQLLSDVSTMTDVSENTDTMDFPEMPEDMFATATDDFIDVQTPAYTETVHEMADAVESVHTEYDAPMPSAEVTEKPVAKEQKVSKNTDAENQEIASQMQAAVEENPKVQ